MHKDLIWVSRNQDLQHNLNPLLWKFHKLPSTEHTVQPSLYHASWYPGRWLCHFIRGITPVFTQKQENREKLMFILFLVGWVLSWSVLLELQWYQQCHYNLPPAEDPPVRMVQSLPTAWSDSKISLSSASERGQMMLSKTSEQALCWRTPSVALISGRQQHISERNLP